MARTKQTSRKSAQIARLKIARFEVNSTARATKRKMASPALDANEFEVKKKLMLSVKGLATFDNLRRCSYCSKGLRLNDWKQWKKCNHYGYFVCENCVKSRNHCNCGNVAKHVAIPAKDLGALGVLLSQLPRFCENENNGCQEVLMDEEMIEHESECVYRKIHCPDLFYGCGQSVTYIGLLDHLAQIHPGNKNVFNDVKTFKVKGKIPQGGQSIPFTKITAFDKTFFEVGFVQNQVIYRWIYILGDPNEAKNFSYHLTIKNERGNQKLSYFGDVRSLNENYQTIIAASDAFEVNLTKAKKFVDDNSNWVVEYKIRNMKEEAKDEDQESGVSDVE